MKSIVEYSHAFLRPVLHRQAYCIDATLGRGKDSSFFLKEGVRKVFAFEIQEEVALETKEKIKDDRLELYLMSHENMDQIHHEIDAIIFNFGYCPNGNPEITTQASSSLKAVKKGLSLLKRKGRMALVFYPHEQGLLEAKEIEAYLQSLDSSYEIIQIKKWKKQSPYLIGIEKK